MSKSTIWLSKIKKINNSTSLAIASNKQLFVINDLPGNQLEQIELQVGANAIVEYQDNRVFDLNLKFKQSLIILAHADSSTTVKINSSGALEQEIAIDAQAVEKGAEILVQIKAELIKTQHHKIKSRQLHIAPATHTNFEIKTVLHDQAISAYQGTITIEKEARLSQANQQHKSLIVSPKAYATAKPMLEAKTDEVQCGHGSAISCIDELQRWYLQSRGIDSIQAEKLLISSFLQ